MVKNLAVNLPSQTGFSLFTIRDNSAHLLILSWETCKSASQSMKWFVSTQSSSRYSISWRWTRKVFTNLSNVNTCFIHRHLALAKLNLNSCAYLTSFWSRNLSPVLWFAQLSPLMELYPAHCPWEKHNSPHYCVLGLILFITLSPKSFIMLICCFSWVFFLIWGQTFLNLIQWWTSISGNSTH